MLNKTCANMYFSPQQIAKQAIESPKHDVKAVPGDDIVVYVRDEEGEEIETYLATFCRTVEDIVVIAVTDGYLRAIVAEEIGDFGDDNQGIPEPLYVAETRTS